MVVDKRKNYIVVLDTETCNGQMIDDKLNLSDSLVYDVGWTVCDTKGNVFLTRSYVVREIFIKMFDVMRSAYYSKKIPQYIEEIGTQERIIADFYNIRQQLIEDMATFNTNIVSAHNCRFDLNALNNTQRWITKSKYRYFFPYSVELWDTLKMASDTFGKQLKYQKWCVDNGYMTNHKKPRARLTAEILYRYISGNNDFIECHTGKEDTLIEAIILAECLKKAKHMPMRKKLFEN